MKRAEQDRRLNEMRRLYEVEKLTLHEVAGVFGLTRQAVYERLAKVGVGFRPRCPTKREIEREILVQLYINENLTVCETAKRLKTSPQKVSDEIKRHKITKRPRGYSRMKYTELNLLNIGEKVIIERPPIKKPLLGLYEKAGRIGIRISIKSLDSETMQIKRTA